MQSSKGMYIIIRPIELIIIIEERILKDDIDAYLKCDNILVFWKKFFSKSANDRDNLYNGSTSFIQHCRERYFCNFNGCKSIK